MPHPGWMRALAWGLAVLLVQGGCATAPHAGDSRFSPPALASSPGAVTRTSIHWSTSASEDEWRAEAGARRAEVEWALAHLGAMASGEERVGAVLELTFWFPRLDINAAANLKALGKPVHESINKIWSVLRKDAGDTVSPEQVRQVAAITQRHFERWFNKVYEPSQSDALLEKATAAALDDALALVAR